MKDPKQPGAVEIPRAAASGEERSAEPHSGLSPGFPSSRHMVQHPTCQGAGYWHFCLISLGQRNGFLFTNTQSELLIHTGGLAPGKGREIKVVNILKNSSSFLPLEKSLVAA